MKQQVFAAQHPSNPSPQTASLPTVAVIAGTRPEAIKLAPVVQALSCHNTLCSVHFIATGQHISLFEDALKDSSVLADTALNLMTAGQSPAQFLTVSANALYNALKLMQPSLVVVQGDTASAYAGALAAAKLNIPIAHVEAGLRTPSLDAPYPEELFRRAITQLATLHFTPTADASQRLIAEGLPPQSIHLTGNSGIDNLLANLTGPAPRDLPINLNSQATPSFGIVTIHRRENRQSRLHSIASALLHVSTQHQLPLLLPLHPSPELAELRQLLGTAPFVRIIDPLPYRHMAWLQAHAAIALTDSGGIQEECATLGTPVVILRDETERMEAVDAGRAILAGAKADAIIAATAQLLAKGRQPRSTLFGDGHAGPAIAQIITRWLHAQ